MATGRRMTTIRRSADNAVTWPDSLLVEPGNSAGALVCACVWDAFVCACVWDARGPTRLRVSLPPGYSCLVAGELHAVRPGRAFMPLRCACYFSFRIVAVVGCSFDCMYVCYVCMFAYLFVFVVVHTLAYTHTLVTPTNWPNRAQRARVGFCTRPQVLPSSSPDGHWISGVSKNNFRTRRLIPCTICHYFDSQIFMTCLCMMTYQTIYYEYWIWINTVITSWWVWVSIYFLLFISQFGTHPSLFGYLKRSEHGWLILIVNLHI